MMGARRRRRRQASRSPKDGKAVATLTIQRANRIIFLLDQQCLALQSQVTKGEKAIRCLSKRLEDDKVFQEQVLKVIDEEVVVAGL